MSSAKKVLIVFVIVIIIGAILVLQPFAKTPPPTGEVFTEGSPISLPTASSTVAEVSQFSERIASLAAPSSTVILDECKAVPQAVSSTRGADITFVNATGTADIVFYSNKKYKITAGKPMTIAIDSLLAGRNASDSVVLSYRCGNPLRLAGFIYIQ